MNPVPDRDALGRSAAALLAGAALGISTELGGALLLYSGLGLLSAAGFILGVALAALAAGVWVGAPDAPGPGGERAGSASRWLLVIAALVLAAIYAGAWEHSAALRVQPAGRAFALLLMVAAPAYALGALLATLHLRARRAAPASSRGGITALALVGAALGSAWAGLILIPRFPAGYVLGASTGVLALAASWETRRRFHGPERNVPMQGRAALVTGVGARGQVGYAVAEALLHAGARVLVTGRDAGVERLAAELASLPGAEVTGVAADLAEPGGATAVVAAARERLGGLDLLVNVAGGLSVTTPLADTTLEEWTRELDRNARTTFLMCHAALPLLRERRGAVVNFASPAGLHARAGLGAYSAAKAAVVALTRALALEEARHGVRVNAVAPGMVDTEQNRAGVRDPAQVRWVTREQVADVVVFLGGPGAAGITGETISVLGGGAG